MTYFQKKKCTKCGSSFRTRDPKRTVCQNCDGGVDKTKQLKAEQEAITAAVAHTPKEPQSVDPRTGLPSEPGKPGPSTASAPPKKSKANAKQ